MPNKIVWKRYLIFFAKVVVSILALSFVARQVDFNQIFSLLQSSNVVWFLPALFLLIFSQYLSAYRLNNFFRALHSALDSRYNVRLYLLGMYYNLFLPGGIGGDAYKMLIINQHTQVPKKSLFYALLLDRLSGLIAIGYLLLLLGLTVEPFRYYCLMAIWLLPLGYGLNKMLLNKILPIYLPIYNKVSFAAIGVQLAQLFCIICIVQGLGIAPDQWGIFSLLFLLSTIAAAFPITIGGAGAREAVFLYGATFFQIEQEVAVATSFLFYMMTVLVSFCGIYFSFNAPEFKLEKMESLS